MEVRKRTVARESRFTDENLNGFTQLTKIVICQLKPGLVPPIRGTKGTAIQGKASSTSPDRSKTLKLNAIHSSIPYQIAQTPARRLSKPFNQGSREAVGPGKWKTLEFVLINDCMSKKGLTNEIPVGIIPVVFKVEEKQHSALVRHLDENN